MNAFSYDPTLTDIRAIATQLSGLRSVASLTAYPLMGLLLTLESVRQTAASLEGKNNYTGLSVRALGVVAGLVLYDLVFGKVVNAAKIVEMSVLSEEQWRQFLDLVGQFALAKNVTVLSPLS